MAQYTIKFQLARYKNNNKKSTGYQKYYLQKAYSQTLSQRGLIDHMTAHGLSVPRAIIEAVFSQVAQCVPEICATGVGVKIDSLGIFYPTVTSEGNYTEEECTPQSCLKGVRVRFLPDSTKLDKITAKVFADKVEPEVVGYVGKTTGEKPKRIVIPYGAQAVPAEEPEP